jgi:putative DNA primase/helicase
MNDLRSQIDAAKARLPLPALLASLGLGGHAKQSARCPFHEDGSNSFSVWQGDKGWQFKCHAGCGKGDEINFLELHEKLTNKDATKRFLEMAGVRGDRTNGATHSKPARAVKPFEWRKCAAAFTDEDVAKIATWRGYSPPFVQWLKERALVGKHGEHFAFPVHGEAGAVTGAHYRLKDGTWRFEPKGSRVRPLVIGDLATARMVHAFESQWDALAVCDNLNMHTTPGFALLVTRGAENGGLVAGLIRPDAELFAWAQNDPDEKRKNGRTPAEKWLATVAENAGCKVRSVLTPAAHKDANDWTRAGATDDDLMAAIGAASPPALEGYHEAHPKTDWPEILPLPQEHPPVAPFDYALLPAGFLPYVRDVAERMQCPPDYIAVGLMCSVGSLVGRKVGIHPKRWDNWLEVCNLWGAVVGPPSIMKSPALSDAMLPLNKLVSDAIKIYKEACAAFADAKEVRAAGKDARKTELAKTLKDLGEDAALRMAKKHRADAKDEPICKRFIVNDVTVEKLGMLLNENPNGLLQFRDELVGWLRSMDKDGHENDRAFLLECWNGKSSYTSDRVERGTQHIEAAIVGVLGGIQPGVLAKYIREANGNGGGSDGLLQRFNLIVWPEITPMFINIDRYPNKEAKDSVMEVFRRLHELDIAGMNTTTDYSTIPALRFSDDAQDRFDQWREGFENGLRTSDEHPALISHLTKHRKAVPVLALLSHLCDGGTGAVGLESLEKGLGWHEYLKTHAAKVYGGIRNGGASPARELLRRIREGDIKDGFTAREVYRRGLAGLDDNATVESGLGVLVATNHLREEELKTGGHPLIRYRFNPRIPTGAQGKALPKPPKVGADGVTGAFVSNGGEVSGIPAREREEL